MSVREAEAPRRPVHLTGADGADVDALVARLIDDDILGQLLERRGTMAALATEDGDVKLGWVDGVAWLLDHPAALDEIERQAAAILERGIRHIVWAGMGGSIQAVRVLKRSGLLNHAQLAVHLLDSTDPAALNRVLRRLCGAEGVDAAGDGLAAALRRTMMVGVSMGLTSEEPITHLEWFESLLRDRASADPAAHLMIMTLPGSFLERFGRQRGAPMVPIQPSGESHTPGRMSAPSTSVFLLPAALALAAPSGGDAPGASGGTLRYLLARCQSEYRLTPGLRAGDRAAIARGDPFVRLAAWLSLHARAGRNKIVLELPAAYQSLTVWIEQVVEESLGKGGRGMLVFYEQDLVDGWPGEDCLLEVVEGPPGKGPWRPAPGAAADASRPLARLVIPALPIGDRRDRLGLLARLFAGWNLTVALFAYLERITFAGQPAVEGYKRYARELRDAPGPLPYPDQHLAVSGDSRDAVLYFGALPAAGITLEVLAATCRRLGVSMERDPAGVLAATATVLLERRRLGYVDVTLNADPTGPLWDAVRSHATRFANRVLRRPVKVRAGPRDYHSTEQSETDGPDEILSIRFLVLRPEAALAGRYSPRFLHAQAIGTMLAMRDAGRPILLGMLEAAGDGSPVAGLFGRASEILTGEQPRHPGTIERG